MEVNSLDKGQGRWVGGFVGFLMANEWIRLTNPN